MEHSVNVQTGEAAVLKAQFSLSELWMCGINVIFSDAIACKKIFWQKICYIPAF